MTSRQRAERLQIGTHVAFRGSPKQPWSFGILVEKTVHWNEYLQAGSYSLLWVKHKGGTGCFWPSDVIQSVP